MTSIFTFFKGSLEELKRKQSEYESELNKRKDDMSDVSIDVFLTVAA